MSRHLVGLIVPELPEAIAAEFDVADGRVELEVSPAQVPLERSIAMTLARRGMWLVTFTILGMGLLAVGSSRGNSGGPERAYGAFAAIGPYLINADGIDYAVVEQDRLVIVIGGSKDHVTLTGTDAEAMKRCLNLHSTDIRTSTGFGPQMRPGRRPIPAQLPEKGLFPPISNP